MSAEANMAGFFPPHGNQVWNENIRWQPIPVHTIPEEEDYILHAKTACDRYEYEMANYLIEDDRFNKTIESYRPYIDNIKENSGMNEMTIFDLEHNIYDTLSVEHLKGFKYVIRDLSEENHIFNNT